MGRSCLTGTHPALWKRASAGWSCNHSVGHEEQKRIEVPCRWLQTVDKLAFAGSSGADASSNLCLTTTTTRQSGNGAPNGGPEDLGTGTRYQRPPYPLQLFRVGSRHGELCAQPSKFAQWRWLHLIGQACPVRCGCPPALHSLPSASPGDDLSRSCPMPTVSGLVSSTVVERESQVQITLPARHPSHIPRSTIQSQAFVMARERRA